MMFHLHRWRIASGTPGGVNPIAGKRFCIRCGRVKGLVDGYRVLLVRRNGSFTLDLEYLP